MRRMLPFLLLLSACTFAVTATEEVTISDRLFCGRSIPGGGEVSDVEVEAFVKEVVTPRFPDGFTVWRARGVWEGGAEETLILEIVHPVSEENERRIREIATIYRSRYRQEAVLRVTMPATMEFISESVPAKAAQQQ